MEITTNELTRPFRIPRKKTAGGNGLQRETTVQGVVSPAVVPVVDGETRSPLLVAQQQPSTSAYGRRIVPAKRKEPASGGEERGGKKCADLLDNIFQAMDRNCKSESRQKTKRNLAGVRDQLQRAIASTPHQSTPPLPSTSSSSTGEYASLTREHLQRHEIHAACYSFAHKGLMEMLLEQKMMAGRLDPCTELGFRPGTPVAAGKAVERVGEMGEERYRDHRRGPRTPPGERHGGPRTPPGGEYPDALRITRTPPQVPYARRSSSFGSVDRRGPRTPPGSPFAMQAMGGDSSQSNRSEYSSTPPPPPPPPPPMSGVQLSPQKSRRDLIAEMAELTKLPPRQLEQCLGEDLQQALIHVDHSVLLDTLRKVFTTIGQQVPPVAEVSSSMSPTRGGDNRSDNAEAAAMDLESSDSSVIGDDTSPLMFANETPLLLAPPPPPILPVPTGPIAITQTSEGFFPRERESPIAVGFARGGRERNRGNAVISRMQQRAGIRNRNTIREPYNRTIIKKPLRGRGGGIARRTVLLPGAMPIASAVTPTATMPHFTETAITPSNVMPSALPYPPARTGGDAGGETPIGGPPTERKMIQTLLTALAIPSGGNRANVPTSVAPAQHAVFPQPPPRTVSPVLLDRYGMPLPVPAHREHPRQRDETAQIGVAGVNPRVQSDFTRPPPMMSAAGFVPTMQLPPRIRVELPSQSRFAPPILAPSGLAPPPSTRFNAPLTSAGPPMFSRPPPPMNPHGVPLFRRRF